MKKLSSSLLLSLSALALSTSQVLAQGGASRESGITNPLLPTITLQDAKSGYAFTSYVVFFWRLIITFGMLAVLIIFLMGAFDWINAGSDKSKIESARNKIINAVIGAILLVGTFAILSFIGQVFNINFLKLDITPLVPTGTN